MPGRELRVRPRDRERGQRRPDAVPQREPRPCRAQAAVRKPRVWDRAGGSSLGHAGWILGGVPDTALTATKTLECEIKRQCDNPIPGRDFGRVGACVGVCRETWMGQNRPS